MTVVFSCPIWQQKWISVLSFLGVLFYAVNGSWRELWGSLSSGSVNQAPDKDLRKPLSWWQRWIVPLPPRLKKVPTRRRRDETSDDEHFYGLQIQQTRTHTHTHTHTHSILLTSIKRERWIMPFRFREQINKFHGGAAWAARGDNETIYNRADVSPWQPVWWWKHVCGVTGCHARLDNRELLCSLQLCHTHLSGDVMI